MHTLHSPLGADAGLDFGTPGEPATLKLPGAAGAPIDFYVGCRSSGAEPWSLLPLFTPRAGGPQPLPKGRYGRFLALAGDKWMIGPLVFKLCAPFPAAGAPLEERFDYAPLLAGYLEYENSHSETAAELLLGFGASGEILADVAGFSLAGQFGFAARPSSEVSVRRDDAVFGAPAGPLCALHFTVPAKDRRLFPIVLGFHCAVAQAPFADLPDLLEHGLAEHGRYLKRSDAIDSAYMRSLQPPAANQAAATAVRQCMRDQRRPNGGAPLDLAALHALVPR